MLKYLGYGTTDANGVAILDHDASGQSTSGYTGVGAGEVDFVAKLHDDDTVVSEPYEVIDGMFYDTGLTGSTVEYVTSGPGSKDVSDNGRVITCTSGNNYQCFANKAGTSTGSWYDWEAPFAVEFDITALTGTTRFQIYSQATNNGNNWDFSQTGHYKIVYDGTSVTKYYDGQQQGTPTSIVMGIARIGFTVDLNNSITVKDFVIYLI